MTAEVNGISIHYKKIGEGEPIIFLHGNGGSGADFEQVSQRLSKRHAVYLIDSRGHGGSSQVPLSYTVMAEDIVQFILLLGIINPIICGFSDGGIVALLVAMSGSVTPRGIIAAGANITPKGLKMRYRLLYQLEYVFTHNKQIKLMLNEPNIETGQLQSICCPTPVVAGSKDIIANAHTKLIADNIKGAELKVLQGENHFSYITDCSKLESLVQGFIDGL